MPREFPGPVWQVQMSASSCGVVRVGVDWEAGPVEFCRLTEWNLTRLLMLLRLLRQLQHVVTALVLLVLLLISAELWLRNTRPVPPPTVAAQADTADQSCLVPSPTYHHQMRPLSDMASENGVIRFRTNSLGLRGPEPQLAAPNGTLRVLLLGDDTVAGTWLREEHTLSTQLQKYLSAHLEGDVEVVNAGVPGYSPILSVLKFDQDLTRLRSQVVVLHFDMSDVADESVHRCSLRRQGNRPICIHPLLTQRHTKANSLLSYLRSSALARAVGQRFLFSASDAERYAWTRSTPKNVRTKIRHAMDSVADLHAMTQAAGQVFFMATAPVWWQVVAPDENRGLSGRFGITGGHPVTDDVPFQVLAAWSRQAGVPYCSAVQAFREFDSPKKFFRSHSPRLSAYGTALYASELARTILTAPTPVAGRRRTVH